MSLGDLAQLLRASSGVAHHIDRMNLRQNASFHLKEVLNNFISDQRFACHQLQKMSVPSKRKKGAPIKQSTL